MKTYPRMTPGTLVYVVVKDHEHLKPNTPALVVHDGGPAAFVTIAIVNSVGEIVSYRVLSHDVSLVPE